MRFWKRPQPAQGQADTLPAQVAAPPPLTYHFDWFWCDASGMYFRGYIFAKNSRIVKFSIRIGEDVTEVAAFQNRTDVPPHFPAWGVPDDCGFEVYAPGLPGKQVFFDITTLDATFSALIEIPRRSLPEPPPVSLLNDQFIRMVNEQHLVVLELGARIVGAASIDNRQKFHGAARYIGMDVHPSPQVDLVGDVHQLVSLVGENTLDAIYSVAVLEHLERPWVVAEQMNRALRPGGLVFHSTVHSWPIHEQPNDFWRFSDEGLKVLFGPAFGFEVLGANMADPVNIYPQFRVKPVLQLPLNPGYAESCILARKVGGVTPDLAPDPARAQAYPVREA